jgi:hypothetical protein
MNLMAARSPEYRYSAGTVVLNTISRPTVVLMASEGSSDHLTFAASTVITARRAPVGTSENDEVAGDAAAAVVSNVLNVDAVEVTAICAQPSG